MIYQPLAELRRWKREKSYFCGYVYKDPNGIWFDGEFTDLDLSDHELSGLIDRGDYYTLYIGPKKVFKLMKDEEIK